MRDVVFSAFQTTQKPSTLSPLNRDGVLEADPPELGGINAIVALHALCTISV
jgi:hypothetical protein